MNTLLCRDATLDDLQYIAANLREADAREIQAGTALPPFQALLRGFENDTETKVIEVNGEVVCVVGYADDTKDGTRRRYPWMMGTPSHDKYPIELVRLFKTTITKWKADGWELYNKVHAENLSHIRLLSACGATFYPQMRGFTYFTI